MRKRMRRDQRGFTLIELLSVIAILGVLAGLVAGAVGGVGASSRTAQLEGDQNTIANSADRFFNDAFPQSYPTVSLSDSSSDIQVAGDLDIREVDFEAVLPGDPLKTFAPDFVKRVPNSAALVSWRIDTRNGVVFFTDDGAQLIRPSTARIAGSASTPTVGVQSDIVLKLKMKKNEAAIEILNMEIPAGYSIGGQSLASGTTVGTLTGTFSTDNPWDPGSVLTFTGTLTATGFADEWELTVDYPTLVNTATGGIARADKTGSTVHTVSIAMPSEEAAGSITITMDTTGDKDHNQATERWTLTILGKVGSDNIITNPSVRGVYRWLTEAHTTSDVEDTFDPMAGPQAVVIKPA